MPFFFFFLDLVVAWIELSGKNIYLASCLYWVFECVLLGLHTRLLLLSLFFSFHVSCPSLCSLFHWRISRIIFFLSCLCIVFFPLWLSRRCFLSCSSLLAAITSLVSSFSAIVRITNSCPAKCGIYKTRFFSSWGKCLQYQSVQFLLHLSPTLIALDKECRHCLNVLFSWCLLPKE